MTDPTFIDPTVPVKVSSIEEGGVFETTLTEQMGQVRSHDIQAKHMGELGTLVDWADGSSKILHPHVMVRRVA